jgi:diguanylate cyclase (GGDEF)-like protein/PAS domain S-box-containing protein
MDIRTLSLLLIVTYVLQVAALYIQYRVNQTYHGLGWWSLAYATVAIGFALLQLREVVSSVFVPIILGNALVVLGTFFLYVGVMRFFELKENPWILYSTFAFFFLFFFYFTYVKDNISARTVIVSVILAGISFLAAQALIVEKPRTIAVSTNFLLVIFLVNGGFSVFRALSVILVAPVTSYFDQTTLQVAAFLEPFIISVLLTYGFIILVNQRLSVETREAKDTFELIFNTSFDATVISRQQDNVIENVNDGFTALTGYTRAETIGKQSWEIPLWQDQDDRQEIASELARKGYCENHEVIFRRKDGTELTGDMSSKLITLQGSQRILSVTRDITERKRLEDELRKLATVDFLTGLTNRRRFLELALMELNRSIRYDCPLTLALVDIDRFKNVNDTYEHTGGDKVLLAFVRFCQMKIRMVDVFARWGGDEFVLLLPETNLEDARVVIDRLRADMAALSIDLRGKPVSITTSWGLAGLTGGQETLETLLVQADKALYRAKGQGRNCVVVWDSVEV